MTEEQEEKLKREIRDTHINTDIKPVCSSNMLKEHIISVREINKKEAEIGDLASTILCMGYYIKEDIYEILVEVVQRIEKIEEILKEIRKEE